MLHMSREVAWARLREGYAAVAKVSLEVAVGIEISAVERHEHRVECHHLEAVFVQPEGL